MCSIILSYYTIFLTIYLTILSLLSLYCLYSTVLQLYEEEDQCSMLVFLVFKYMITHKKISNISDILSLSYQFFEI